MANELGVNQGGLVPFWHVDGQGNIVSEKIGVTQYDVYNSVISLVEFPDLLEPFRITCEDSEFKAKHGGSTALYRVSALNDALGTNQYRVNEYGFVTFNPFMNGKRVTVGEFWGRGGWRLAADNVMLRDDRGDLDLTKTLGDYLKLINRDGLRFPVYTGGTGTKYTAVVDGLRDLAPGITLGIQFHTNSTSASPSLNVNGFGDKPIRRLSSGGDSGVYTGKVTGWLRASRAYVLVYDGNNWLVQGLSVPESHASSGNDFGVGTSSSYGHLKLSDSVSSSSGDDGGIAATPSAVKSVKDSLDGHENKSDNPHGVTKTQVGLSNVDNTSDANKPISTAVQTALGGKSDTGHDHTVTVNQGISEAYKTSGNLGQLFSWFGKVLKGIVGKTNWYDAPDISLKGASDHVNNKNNPHGVTKEQIGLGNVENTSDSNKGVSVAVQGALDGKSDVGHGHVVDVDQGIAEDFNDSGSLGQVFSWFGKVLRAVIGKGSWHDVPDISLWGAYEHTLDTDNPHGITKEQLGLSASDDLLRRDVEYHFDVAYGLLGVTHDDYRYFDDEKGDSDDFGEFTDEPEGIVVDYLSTPGGVLSSVQDVTYDELKALKKTNQLVAGNKYRITDFRTIYRKPNGCDASGSSLWLTDGRETDPNPSVVEPLIITAVTDSSFEARAISVLYPEDIIYFSFDENMQSDKGYEIYEATSTKGFIYRRISKNKVDMPFDFRNVKWRRWEVDYEAIDVWDNTLTYQAGAVVRNKGTADNIVYLSIKNVPSNQNLSGTEYWIPILDLSKTKYWATTNFSQKLNEWQVSYGETSHFSSAAVPLTGNYRDSFTFTKYDGTSEPNLDKTRCRCNSVLSGYNFVFYSNGGDFRYNTIGNNFYNNTIGSDSRHNVIDNNFYSNTIGNNFYSNTIGNTFNFNTIGNTFNSNTIGNNFNHSTIGNDFYSNTIGNNLNYNIIGNSFNRNAIGNNFNRNAIGNGFSRSGIGSDFYSNTIGNNFYHNAIGNNFNRNTIGNTSRYNSIGNDFYLNSIGNDFYSNTIGSSFNSNTIGNSFRSNTIGNNFNSNAIGTNVYSNNIGNHFISNTIDDHFGTNTIGSDFRTNTIGIFFNSNSIGDDFNNNTIDDYLYNNAIGTDFTSNAIGKNFRNNVIGNEFRDNNTGEEFTHNTIGNFFYSNIIGNNFGRNTIDNDFVYNTIGIGFSSNAIGNAFSSNTIGNEFYFNTIGNDFRHNTIGNNFYYNTIGNAFRYNTIGNEFYFNTILGGFWRQGYNFTPVAELYSKMYSHIIQVTANDEAIMVTWYIDADLQTILLPRQ